MYYKSLWARYISRVLGHGHFTGMLPGGNQRFVATHDTFRNDIYSNVLVFQMWIDEGSLAPF